MKAVLIIFLLVWSMGTLGQSLAGEEQMLSIPSQLSLPRRAKEYFFTTFPRHLFAGFTESFFQLENVAWLALAGGVAAGLQGPDKNIQTYFREEQPFAMGKEIGNILGTTGVLFALTGLTFGVGELTETPALAETGVMMFEALSLTATVTTLFKVGVNRRRPDNSDKLSFPSGHASGSFALATVVAKQYGLLAGIPAYLTATWVSMARMQKDKHFFSDNIFGATLGTVIANAMVNVHRQEKEQSKVILLPVVSGNAFGLFVSIAY